MAKRNGLILLRTLTEPVAPKIARARDSAPIAAPDVARHAYQIYLWEGRPEGRQTEHWLQAERELLSVHRSTVMLS